MHAVSVTSVNAIRTMCGYHDGTIPSCFLVCRHGLEFLILAMISQLPARFNILSNDFTTVLAYHCGLAYIYM